jgi:hypothetical protein
VTGYEQQADLVWSSATEQYEGLTLHSSLLLLGVVLRVFGGTGGHFEVVGEERE